MRIAIVADIHGNWQALQAVLADIEAHNIREIYSLGDNIGYGPEPEEVVLALQQHRVVSVMGNHELALISRSYYQRMHSVARESLDCTARMLSPASRTWLANLPPYHLRHGARLVHGCPPHSMTVYLFSPSITRLQRLFTTYPEQLCFVGHTHALSIFQEGFEQDVTPAQEPLGVGVQALEPQRRYIIMPGSAGQPRDTLNRKAKYLLWDRDNQTIEVRALAYDVQTTIRLLEECGFPAINAKRLAG